MESLDDWTNLVFDGGKVGDYVEGEDLPLETPADRLAQDDLALIISLHKTYLPGIKMNK